MQNRLSVHFALYQKPSIFNAFSLILISVKITLDKYFIMVHNEIVKRSVQKTLKTKEGNYES